MDCHWTKLASLKRCDIQQSAFLIFSLSSRTHHLWDSITRLLLLLLLDLSCQRGASLLLSSSLLRIGPKLQCLSAAFQRRIIETLTTRSLFTQLLNQLENRSFFFLSLTAKIIMNPLYCQWRLKWLAKVQLTPHHLTAFGHHQIDSEFSLFATQSLTIISSCCWHITLACRCKAWLCETHLMVHKIALHFQLQVLQPL